jgi:hypothetical protein
MLCVVCVCVYVVCMLCVCVCVRVLREDKQQAPHQMDYVCVCVGVRVCVFVWVISVLCVLCQNSDDMKCRMEALIMRIQAEVCRALEEQDGEKKFLVDRWLRKEASLQAILENKHCRKSCRKHF